MQNEINLEGNEATEPVAGEGSGVDSTESLPQIWDTDDEFFGYIPFSPPVEEVNRWREERKLFELEHAKE